MRYDSMMPSKTYDLADAAAIFASAIPSTLAKNPNMRFDSAEDAAIFFARELDFIKSETYDVQYRTAQWRSGGCLGGIPGGREKEKGP